MWNAFMVEGATFCGKDEIPFCPTTLTVIPGKVIAYDETRSSPDCDALVHFYQDDQKFDGKQGIWLSPQDKPERIGKYSGIITPDFSTYQDMPRALKVFNTYKMRAFGYWMTTRGIPVVNNVRWGDPDTYEYSFAGLPKSSILAIGSHGCIRQKENQSRFEQGLEKMVELLEPHTIIVYGSMRLPIFDWLRKQNINLVGYSSRIHQVMAKRKGTHE